MGDGGKVGMESGGQEKYSGCKREKIPLFHTSSYKFEGCVSTLLKYCLRSDKTGHLSVKELRRMLLKCLLSLSICFQPA